MTPEQFGKISALHDRLVTVALRDADPDNWVAGEKKPSEMTRDERGDAKWCRGLAISTVALTLHVQRFMQTVTEAPAGEVVDDVEGEIARFERAAAEVIDRAASHATKR